MAVLAIVSFGTLIESLTLIAVSNGPADPALTASALKVTDPPVPAASEPLDWIQAPPLVRSESPLPVESKAPGEVTARLMLPPFCHVWPVASKPDRTVSTSLVQSPRTSNVTPSPTFTPGRAPPTVALPMLATF